MGSKLPAVLAAPAAAGRRSPASRLSGAAIILAAALGAGCERPPAPRAEDPAPGSSVSWRTAADPILPVPSPPPLDARKVALGERLFHDVRLSADDNVSCATCHQLGNGGADGRPRSVGIRGRLAEANAPTVFNSALNIKQRWDGGADSLETQIDGPVHDAREMGASWPAIIAKLKADPVYAAAFGAIYGGGIRADSIRNAIATFERSLVTPNSRFDRYLNGETAALTVEEVQGFQLFKSYGCASCHQGANVGGNTFAKLDVMRDYFSDGVPLAPADLGRFRSTGRQDDRHVFKVPGLRMAAVTAPYFHDGSVATLEQAVAIMGAYQLGIEIPAEDVASIVAFLRTLPGQYSG